MGSICHDCSYADKTTPGGGGSFSTRFVAQLALPAAGFSPSKIEHTKRDLAGVDQSSSGSGAWLLVNST